MSPAPQRDAGLRAVLDLLGLATRAGALVSGTDAVRRAVRDGGVHRVLLAEDAAPAQRDKLVPLLQARGVPHHTLGSQAALGAAIGRAPVSALGLTNPQLARRVGDLVAALPVVRRAAEPRTDSLQD